jgi:hypothetical protein
MSRPHSSFLIPHSCSIWLLYSILMMRVAFLIVLAALAAACSDPPQREYHQAQGAIDAAKAAGAEEYAPVELAAAVAALERYDEAVAQRDYRLALSVALDASERARDAARQAADRKAARRGEAEAAIAAASTALQQLHSRLGAARAARVAARDLRAPAAAASDAEDAVQKARAALAREDYAGARTLLDGVSARLAASSKALDAALARRRR